MKSIRAKYAGKCIYCGDRMAKGCMVNWRKDLGICCSSCYQETYLDSSDYQPNLTGNELVTFTFSSGAVAYQNRKGRCEDAPCCGCCTC